MKEIKEFYLNGNYFEVGITTIFLIILLAALICFIVFLIQGLIKSDFKYKSRKDKVTEIKQGFKKFIKSLLMLAGFIKSLLVLVGIVAIFITITYITGFIVKLFI